LRHLGPARYAEAFGDHRRVLREAFVAEGGVDVIQQLLPELRRNLGVPPFGSN
jgi:hypothetical protein